MAGDHVGGADPFLTGCGAAVFTHAADHSSGSRDGALPDVPLLRNRREPAVLSAGSDIDRHVRRFYSNPIGNSHEDGNCSMSVSRDRSRVSLFVIPALAIGLAYSKIIPGDRGPRRFRLQYPGRDAHASRAGSCLA